MRLEPSVVDTYVVVGGMYMKGNTGRYVVWNNCKFSSACSGSKSARFEYEVVVEGGLLLLLYKYPAVVELLAAQSWASLG